MSKAQIGDLVRTKASCGWDGVITEAELYFSDNWSEGICVYVSGGKLRLTDSEYEVIRKQAHAAQVGDLIRITKARDEITAYKLGGIYEVISLEASNYDQIVISGIGGNGYVLSDEYEIHRKKGEEDSPCEYPEGTVLTPNGLFTVETSQDAVNSPNHYGQGRVETIEVIEDITSGYSDGYVAYCVGNTIKYLARAPHKHDTPTEDLRKAAKYLEFAIGKLTQ